MVAVSKWAINMLAPANEPLSSVEPFRLAKASDDPVAATEVRMADVPVTLDRSAPVRLVRTSVADEIVAFVRSASVRLASVRSVLVRLTEVAVALVRAVCLVSALSLF